MAVAARLETVTVVFTDVVESTAWRVRVGDDAADVRTAEFERASRQVVESLGGAVVKSVGDGVMATFPSAVAGLEAAATLQSMARRLAVGGSELCLRVGVSTGDMVREGDDWLGGAAIEASRLCGEAAGGSVLVADATVRLSRGRFDHVVRLVGERILRGFEVPIDVYELVDEGDDGPLPSALVTAGSAPMVGRLAELQRCRSLLETVTGGGSVTVFVVGEPGVGKTRLAAAVAGDAVSRGFTVLHGRCDEGLAVPYQPVVEAFDPWLASCPDAALPRFLGDDTPLVNLWPKLTPRLGAVATGLPEDPEAQRWRLFEAVARLVGSITRERPLLLVLDDVQWAEPSTLRLLGHLARKALPRFALVATVRRAEAVTGAAGLLGDLGSDRTVEIVELSGLDRREVGQLVAVRTGEAPPDNLAAGLRRHTDGNPFFVASLLAHLEEVAFVRSPEGLWVTAADLEFAGVPEDVRGVIARRLALLDPAARRVLDAGAVVGLVFEARIVGDAARVDREATVDALDAAMAADLLREEQPGRYGFAHALVRQAVLDDLSRTRQATLHWRIAEQLESHEPSRFGEIAHHYASGRELGDDATVVRTSLAAGEDSARRLAFEEATDHLRTALAALDRLPPDSDLRYRILASLGRALQALVQPDEARERWMEAANIARDAGDPERMFAAVQGYGFIARLSPDDQLVRLLEDLLDVLGPSDSALRASALGWRAQPVQNFAGLPSLDDIRMTDDAVAMARRTDQADALVSTLHSRLLLELQVPDARAMLRDAQEVLAALEHAGPTWDRNFSVRLLILALLRVGRRADAERHLDIVQAAAEQSGLRLSSHNALQLRSALATASGRFSEGKALAAETAQRAGRHIPVVELGYTAQILAGRMEQGRLDEVIAALDGLDRLDLDLPGWRAMRAGALADAGRLDEASESLYKLVANTSSVGVAGVIGPAPMAIRHLSEVCRRLGNKECATRLLDHVTPWAGQMLMSTWGLSIDGASDRAVGHLLATLGRLDEADAAYTSAAELEHSAAFPPFVARTQYWHARALLERDAAGDHHRARALLDDVIERSGQLGMMQLHRYAGSTRDLV